MEAWGLGAFMTGASLLTTLLEYPQSPAHIALLGSMRLRLGLLGLGMGLVVAGIVYSPWGQRSGAHINPAVTWAFFRLGKIRFWDAIFYTAAQFLGAVVAVQCMALLIGAPYRHPDIRYVVTESGPPGALVAFAAEFVITFVLMLVLLCAVNRKALEKWVGAIVAVLIALYLLLETPYSGMSLNPARSTGSALAAWRWGDLWIYFTAPVLAALLAAELYWRFQKHRLDGPSYPVAKKEKEEE